MAATATLQKTVMNHGMGGHTENLGTLTFDSDATVEVPLNLKRLLGIFFTRVGSGGEANVLSLDETANADGEVSVPAGGTVTVDATASNSNTYFYRAIGY